jgi:hypothetical protein
MSKVFKVWLDSGANIHSNRSVIISLEELGYTDEEWEAMSEVYQKRKLCEKLHSSKLNVVGQVILIVL